MALEVLIKVFRIKQTNKQTKDFQTNKQKTDCDRVKRGGGAEVALEVLISVEILDR